MEKRVGVPDTHYWSQLQRERRRDLRRLERSNGTRYSYAQLFLAAGAMIVVPVAIFISLTWYRNYAGATGLEFSGNVINVRAGGNFQAALDRARPGDTIQLQAGAVFKGAFKLPKKSGNEFVIVRSAAPDSQLPAAGTRIDPVKYASALPKLLSNVRGEPTIATTAGAHHYRFIGIEFGPTMEGVGNIVQLGTTEEKTIEDLPHHIEFDRVYIHGSPIEGQRRGIAANGRNVKIENSYISDIKRKGEESQAICIWGSDGPVEIINNYLEAAAENILFGGGGSYLKLIPADSVVRDNFLNKPLEWMDQPWVVKNLFEIKNGRRIKVTNNLMTNNWTMGQDGMAIVITTRADNGPESIIEDIEFTGNIVRGSGGGLNLLGEDASGGHRLLIQNNVFDDISDTKWRSVGHFMKSNTWDGLTIENNTIIQTGNITNAYGEPIKNFVFRNNIVFENLYGIKGDNMGSGQEVIDKLFSRGQVAGNIIIGGRTALYRERNYYPRTLLEIGFVNPSKGDYRLRPDSPYINKGVGGKSIGANLDPSTVGRSAGR